MVRCIALLFFLWLVLIEAPAQSLDKVIAVVNNGIITESELNSQVALLKSQLESKNMQLPPMAILRKQVLQHLIDIDLQLQLAKENNIAVDNSELNEAIKNISSANNLSFSQLREEIQRQGLTWETYKENIRKEILVSKLQQKAIGKEIQITPMQIENYLKTAQQNDTEQFSYHVQNIVIPLPEEPTTEQLKKAREKAEKLLIKIKKGENFSSLAIAESSGEFALEGGDLGERHLAELPEIFAQRVVKMKPNEVAGPIRTGNGFQLIKLLTITGEKQRHEVIKTHVRHILLKSDTSLTQSEARTQAYNLYQQLKSGKDFSLIAKQYSSDTASSSQGGDLGWINPGELLPEFEKVMNALPLKKISKPVKTVYGWHLIQVLERKKIDDTESFKHQQVRRFLQQRKFAEAVQNWQQHLRASAYIKIMDKKLA